VYKNAIAKAIIVKNLGHRLIGNVFLNINMPPAPTRLFKTEAEARKWLDTKTRAYFAKNKSKALSI
jgi:hypothetical protein